MPEEPRPAIAARPARRPDLDEYYLAMLPLVASRGTCPRRQVACVLADERGRLVATGYNGNPSGAAHCSLAPCRPCAAALLSVGVTRVVALESYKYDNAGPALLAKAGVALEIK